MSGSDIRADLSQPRNAGEEQAIAEGIPLRVYRSRWRILGVLCLALSATMLANTSLGVALPYLARDLQASMAQQQWFNNAYALVFAGLLFTTSTIADRYGRKLVLQTGMILFGAASLYVWLWVDSSAELIAARAVLGLGAAMIMPVTLSILTSVFTSAERTRAVSLWAAVSGGGTALGPVVAGLLLEISTWQSVFAINLPVVVVGVLAGFWLIPSRTSTATSTGGGIDLPGALLSTAGITLVVYALIEAQHVGWTAPRTLVLTAAGLVLVALFALWESRAEQPMLDVSLFRNTAFSASAVVITLVFFAMVGVFFSLSQTLILIFGYSPLNASLSLLPMTVVMVLIAPQIPELVRKFGPRTAIAGGMVVSAAGMVALSTLDADSGYWHLLGGLAVTALGMSVAMAPATDVLMANVPRERAGMGSATNDVTREVGASLGVAVLGSVLGSSYAAQLTGSVAALPDQAQQLAKQSLAGGLQVATSLGQHGLQLVHDVRAAWMHGLQVAHLVGAGLILLAALVAWVWLPRSTADREPGHRSLR
ncbi:MFS transporter [Saccharopolyspora rectivirgula]|uniref:MFS transporter n=1 Tax=Saccharopolyspora rectivirgula TaxID=28042 RepID=UPI000689108E|nr:MFS transporter [Saccharopolyspora rectivirgula]